MERNHTEVICKVLQVINPNTLRYSEVQLDKILEINTTNTSKVNQLSISALVPFNLVAKLLWSCRTLSDNNCKKTSAFIKYFHSNHSHCIFSTVLWDIQKFLISPLFTNEKPEWNNGMWLSRNYLAGQWYLRLEARFSSHSSRILSILVSSIIFILICIYLHFYTHMFLCHSHSTIFFIHRRMTWLKIISIHYQNT